MAARTRLIQLAIGIVNILIVALVFTSIWPFPSGNFKVDLPSPGDITWSYEDGVAHIVAPVTIDNRWIYDVNDLAIYYMVRNYTGYTIAEEKIVVGTIAAGQVTEAALDFNFEILRLYNDGAISMVFNDDMLTFYLEVSCKYTAKLIKFFASYQVSVPWDALIKSYGISDIRHPSTLPMPGETVNIDVDYWLHTSDLLAGLPQATVTIRYYGNQTELGSISTTIALGGNYTETVQMGITLSYYSNYYVELQIVVADYTIHETVAIEGLFP